ncbi:YSIRK-type signal peptide-containing protein, partial [Streptococcus sp. 15.1]
MKDIFNRRQRFSLRKYSFGVASVLLGTALFAAHTAQADEVTAPDASSSNPDSSVEGESSSNLIETSTASTAQADPTAAVSSTEATASTFNLTPEASTTDKAAAGTTDKQATETAKSQAAKPASEAAKPTEKAATETAKPATAASTNAASNKVETTASATAAAATPAATAANRTAATAAPVAEETAAAETAAATTSLNTRGSARFYSVGSAAVRSATLDRAATDLTNAGALATRSSRRNRRAATDHNNEPVAVATFLKDGEVATPEMTDPNGASVRSQTVPSGYAAKEGDVYTYSIVDLTRFNERYNTSYYVRAYKRFDASTDTTVELINKNTGAVVETRTITASSGIQKFTTTQSASKGELTFQVDYDKGLGAGPGKTDQPFIQFGYEVGASIQALVAPGHNLTTEEQKLYDAVYAARTSTDIINVVEPAYNGRTITDTNAKIPVSVNKTTYYKVVDKNNPTFKANKTDVTVQDYKANGNEVDLASYTLKAMEGQNFTASGERQFDGYKLYQAAEANDQSGYVSRPYTVGTKFMDAERAGIKRIKEIVGEDGTVVVRVYLLDPKQQSKRSDGTLSTDGYMLLAETKPIKPGDYNKQELAVKKSPLNTIAFTDSKGVTYANGKEVPFDFQKAAGYTPYKTVFVPFLGDNIGHLSPNEQLVRGVNGIGTNVDLLNSLTPYKQPVYYYVKQEPVTVTPEVEKQLEGRVLVDGEFSFKIKEVNENKSLPSYEETVTNKNGKATFSNLTFNKVGTYIYTITEVKGADTNVDYDGMTVKMTVTVTENSKGDLQASVKYSGTGGFASSADDKVFNNYVVAPVKTKFDFSKALAGRELKAGEFSFVLKDSTGKVLQTKKNTKEGVVAFDDLTFDNTQVGTHKYTVEEVIPENKEAGMTYDTMKAEVTITVTKEGHVLKATNTLPADTEFNNTFTPGAIKVNLEFDKSLSNGTLNAGDFSFTLTGDNNVNETVTNKANGKINFSELSFDREGVYNYTVKEVKGNNADVDYDEMTIAVKVTVTKDAATGLLVAKTEMTSTGGEATGTDDKIFNNHVVAPVTAQFDFSKALAGRDLKAGEFSFVLKDKDGKVLQTKQNDANGKVKFDALTFTNAQVGDHKYTVEEVQGTEAGMTYDPMKANVTVTVTKSGHALTAVATLPTDKEFNNTFTSAPTQAQFKFTKRLEGKALEADAFTFELLENGNVIQTKKNAADGSITFDAIEYSAEGEHTYTVREKAGNDTNIDYDTMNAVVKVKVTKDAATGLLSTAVTMPEDTEFNNYVVAPVVTKFDFTKKLAGRELKAGEFSFVLKDSTGAVVETVKNDAAGNVSFSNLSFDNTKVGTHTYKVEEVIPANKEFGMTYDKMKATVTVEVAKNGHTLTTVTNVTSTGGVDANGNATDGTADKEFNNKVTPPETPEFQPEKFVVSKEKYDITGDKLMDDDDDVPGNEYTATNANPYVDGVKNNEPENLNTKTVERGSKLVYQVWLDTTKFTEANNIQYVGVSDKYDAEKLDVNAADIKAYDSVTGADVTAKFDIKVENGTITATSKDEFIKDKVNNPVIDTTKFAFGRYYKFDIPATVKESVKAGADIENTANQTVHVYNPVSKTVEKPEKPTQKRVNSVPVPVEMNFTKRLEGRELQANEFEFVLKKDGVEVERVKNDAAGKIVFKTLKFGRDDLGKTYNYTVEETPGTDTTVKYDTMVATVKVVVSHDGTAKAIVANVTDAADKEFNNRVTPPEEPKFQPEKYVVSEEKFDITGDKLVDDDKELADKYADTNANPYADDASNNEAQNINTKTVKRGDKLVYQVWLDTTKFDAANKDNIQSVGISDDYDETKLELDATKIKAYDSVTGDDVTAKFDITVNNGVITATLKDGFTKSLGDAENTQVIDTTKFAFGRYYKFDIPTTVKADVPGGADIENTAAQVVNYYNPTTKKVEKPTKPTEKRVNNVPVEVEFNFTKRLEGRELKANEFSFVLKDSEGKTLETVSNDAAGNVKFSKLEFKKGQEGVHNYTVEEVKGSDATVTYDTMKANVTVTVKHDGTAKVLIATVGDIADKEFNNRVTPPEEPKFQPEKYVLNTAKFSITDNKLLDDDAELTDKYGETNTDPYVDKADNNEAENINTKSVKRGEKIYYQVWLDTTKFDAANKDNVQTVGITDDYDETKVDVDGSAIKAYDSVTGADVTDKFDINVENGVMTATLKAGFTKSLGDAENTQIIDTTKFEFGRYYKFDIPATVKNDVPGGADIENTAAQVVNYYNPVSKTVEKPNKPTEKRVNNVPVEVEFNFTKRLEGRELKANEFSFVLKDSEGKTLETVSNDASGNVKFSKLEFKKGQEGVHNYTVEEVKGSDATVTYDTMKANVTVTVKHDGTAKVLIATVGDIADKEFNNRVTPPEEPKFQPEKYVVSKEKFDITGDKLVDDDKELADKYADTNANPYADDASNNEKENLNTKTVKRGDKLVYQVWLDTTKFDAANKDNIQSVGISDDYDEAKLELDATKIKAYDSVTGDDVTAKFDITVNNGVITATLKDGFTKSLGDAENTQVIDTTKFAFGRYYKFDIPTTVKADVPGGSDIENTAAQVVNYYNPTTKKVEKPNKPTEKRVNNVPVEVEFNFTKRLEGRELKANEFSFVLKDSEGKTLETVSNDASGNVKFSKLEFKKGQEGVHNYTVEEVKGSDATVTYDTMKANVTVTVKHDGTAKVLIATVGEIADKEFNNRVTPPEEPKFQPEKYVVGEAKFDVTGTKLVDDDKELADKYADTNANPYADDASNNEAENLNTKSVKRGQTIYYQVWLDTTKFDANNKDNIQTVGITDDFDETKLNVDASAIKAYDSVSGADVTDKFDISIENGVITANLKAGFTKSLGDAENTQVIDTTKFAFGRYYKFDIPTTVKADVPGGVDIENTAAQVVNYYNPTTKKVEKPNKPTEKRVNNVPVEVEFNFTKRLEGRELKANEFSFVLKDSEGKTLETVSNDASGNVKFKALEFKKGQEGVHNYTVEEVKGTDATVTYDTMKANVTVTVKHDGTAKVLIATVGDIADKEFNNRVTPPEEPKFQPEKYVLSKDNGKFDITGTKLLDDDAELTDKYAETNANPYADKADNNEAENINTKAVKRGDTINYQVWLDTNQFDANNKDNIQTVGITDDYDEAKLEVKQSDIKAYDGKTGADVTDKFDISIANGVITANLKAGFTKSLGDAENTQIIDTTKFEFGRYYKFVIPAKVTDGAYDGAEIENTAAQVVNYYNPTTKTVEKPNKPTEKRVNNVPTAIELIFGKTLNGRQLKDKEFNFVLKDEAGKVLETVQNDAKGKVTFSTINYGRDDFGKTFNYTVEEVKGTDTTVTYDNMKVNVTVKVIKPSADNQLSTVISYATVGGNTYESDDRIFDNNVTPNFKPEKYVVSEPSFDIIGNKLADDDDSADKVEIQNLNGKTLKRGQKIYYQVWLDTRDFTAESNLQTVGITDNYEEAKLDIDASEIKVYDGITGKDVTDKFDIKVENGVLYGTSKASLTKAISATDATPVIDTTKFEFGRYYKFDIPAVVKDIDANDGVDIENTANQTIHQYNPFNKKVTTPEKPTQTRENNVPVPLEFDYTKRLEGRELTAGEFSFVLKDQNNKVLQTVTNDKDGHIKFEKLLFSKADLGKTFTYTVEEVPGKDNTVSYDGMVAKVTVEVTKEGKVLKTVANYSANGGNASGANDKEFNNKVRPPETPKFQPEKYVVNKEKFDITGNKLVDDDKELKDKYAETNANPYADDASNNEAENMNTKTVKAGDKLVYQVWLDTTKFDANNKDYIQTVGISDDYDETKLDLDASAIKAYDSVTGEDVTAKFDIKVENGMITANLKDGFTKSLGDDANTQIIDTTKFAFGRYYKFDIPTTVKDSVPGGVDIENTAGQVVHFYNPTTKKVETPKVPTEKRVNSVPVEVGFNFTKRLEGRELKANEFTFELKNEAGKVVETVKNDAAGNVKFSKLEFKKGQDGVHKYTVEEVKGTDATVTYDTMKANVTITVSHDGTAKALVATVGEIADKEFNNAVRPPEKPKFQPEKYVVSEAKFDVTGTKLVDDDKELANKVADTNTNPYADDASNNELENLNTKSVKPGQKLYYQVWLDTTQFDANNKDHIQTVGITDDYDETKLDVDASAIKAYDSVSGADVTSKFDIKVENGVVTANLKDGFTKSLGDAENTQVIDTTKFEFGRYYKFDIPATVKADVAGGVDIENTASQIVHQYDPTKKSVEKPEKPTEKRVVNIPVEVEFNFTKKLEGRELKANEFSFVLKDKDGNILQTVKNDAAGNVKFAALEFKKGQEGTHNYTVEEVKGTDGTVSYDSMKALVTVEVSHDGKAKALITKVNDPADKEFNNTVRPPEKPKFQPEKYVVSKEKFDITGMKLVDDDAELKDKVGDTNKDPYADSTANNEAENINTKTLKKGDKFVYQVWLDTTNFTDAHNIQSVGVTDKYDSENLTVNVKDIKAYDSVTGEDVTAKFDIQIVDGVITATSKADLTKSLGDAENTQVIDTAKLAFGRYYKFDIPATIKGTAKDGVDIENTASQIVHQYDPTKKSVEKPEKPTEKRVVNIPTKVEFEFTKKLEGRELKPGEFSFVLKDSKGNVIETVSNDANGKIKFSALEYKRGEEGTHVYTVEEVQGNDATVAYDKMVATVVVSVTKDGKVLTVTSQLPEDTEFN